MHGSVPAPPPVSMPGLSCDYLVVGAGATAMAFVDELINNSRSTVVMVDTRAKPGGHWNDAYDFVRLHQVTNIPTEHLTT